MKMTKLRAAVIGVGYLGRFHAEKYQQLANVELVAVCDTSDENRFEASDRLGVKAFQDYQELPDLIDVVSIATPTTQHYAIALFFLERGVHVLLEKPITTDCKEADALIEVAKQQHCILQIGHLEQFNSAMTLAMPLITTPRLINIRRYSPFRPRCLDVDVVLDLMIHDIELVQSLLKCKIRDISANGMTMLSPTWDVAQTHMTFENDCVVTMSASRIHATSERIWHIFQDNGEILMDFNQKKVTLRQANKHDMTIDENILNNDAKDSLKEEIAAFIDCVIHQKSPKVDGRAGRNALKTALQISQLIRNSSS